MTLLKQAPVRNASVVGAQVYSHSGEYAPQVVDFQLPSRGVLFQFVRSYRSAHHHKIGPLGRGWTFSYAKWIEHQGNDVTFHDGWGRVHQFVRPSVGDCFSSPDGFYAVLEAQGDEYLLKQRHGDVLTFEHPESGGRLLAVQDGNGNTLKFEYRDNTIIVTEPLDRHIQMKFEQDRVVEVSDGIRHWHYGYNDDGCLVEVLQPLINGLAERPRVTYAYDQGFRLISITDPNGQTFLHNSYDDQGRVQRQEHGNGTIGFEYERIGETAPESPIYRTHVRQKNGSQLDLQHDGSGHIVNKTLFVSAQSLSREGRNGVIEGTVQLTSVFRYNHHGELIRRSYPAGDADEWVYDEENADLRAQGDLLQVIRIPSPESQDSPKQLMTCGKNCSQLE